MLSARGLNAAALAWLAASSAHARVVLDYAAVGEFTQPFSYSNCGVSVRAHADATLTTSADMNVNAASGGPGIAVEGHNALSFDGGEALHFEFWDDVTDQRVAVTEISYVSSVAPGASDGDAVPAEVSIQALGPGGGSLGVHAFSGAGERAISVAFGGQAIESLVMSAIDPVRIEGIAYEPVPGTGIRVQWTFGGAYEREQIQLCGVGLDGSNTLTVGGVGAGGDGVGVKGGSAGSVPDTLIDTGETLEIAFAEPATEVAYHQSSNLFVTVVGGVAFDLEAFDPEDASLGTEHLLTDVTDIDVSALFGDVALSRFVIAASPGGTDGQQLGSVTFVVPEPGGAASGLAALGVAAALARRRRGADRCGP